MDRRGQLSPTGTARAENDLASHLMHLPSSELTADQVLQQVTGSPVTGKIVVLVCIILFLQWKPGGLFAIRSRSLD